MPKSADHILYKATRDKTTVVVHIDLAGGNGEAIYDSRVSLCTCDMTFGSLKYGNTLFSEGSIQ